MLASPVFAAPVVESVTLTLSVDEARNVEQFLLFAYEDFVQSDEAYNARADARDSLRIALLTALEGRSTEPAWLPVVRDAWLANRKILAIKEYRTALGCGLKEAKDAVEALAAENGWVPTP
jgi:ribosomal protein L7/L12